MSEIKTTCRGTSRLIEVATMTHEEYLNLHTQGEKELRAAYEALQKELGYSKMLGVHTDEVVRVIYQIEVEA